MSKTLLQKLKAAIENDPAISTTCEKFREHPGNDLFHLETFLGLTKSDLKKLERMRHVIRAYTQNVWYPGDVLPNGKTFEVPLFEAPKIVYDEYVNEHGSLRRKRRLTTELRPQYVMKGKGRRVKWIILSDGPYVGTADKNGLNGEAKPSLKDVGITTTSTAALGADASAPAAKLEASTPSSLSVTGATSAESNSLRQD